MTYIRGQVGALRNQIEVALEQAVASASPAPSGQDLSGELERLVGLRDSGALSEEEFTQADARLLNG